MNEMLSYPPEEIGDLYITSNSPFSDDKNSHTKVAPLC